MNKQTFLHRSCVIFSLFWILGSISGVQASLSYSDLEISEIKWIAPNATQIDLGLNAEFAYSPNGTMQIVYLDPEAYSSKLLYIDNATGDWSPSVVVADPQYGAMNPQIRIDHDNNTQVGYKADNGGVYFSNISDGVWNEVGMGGSQLSSFVPRMAIGPDNTVHSTYYWLTSSSSSYNGGITYINSSHNEAHNTNNSLTRFEQFPSIAVDSTGLVHLVFEGSWNNTALGSIAVRDLFYQTFNPNEAEPSFSELVRLSSVPTTGDYVMRPSIICDSEDNLHVVYIETKTVTEADRDVHRAFVKYLRIDDTPSSEDAEIVNSMTASMSYPSVAVDSDGDVHIVYVSYPQTEASHYYTTDIAYSTNKSGNWVDERITNQPYAVLMPRIAIHPLTDEPTILYLIKQAYTTDAYMMEYVESRNGSFGVHFDVTTTLSSANDFVNIMEEEAYSYILITPNQPILYELEFNNKYNEANNIDIDFSLLENDYISLVNGTSTQTITNGASDSVETLQWYIQTSSGQSSEIELQVSHAGEIIGKIIYFFNIGSGASIGVNNFSSIVICGTVTTSILVVVHKRRR